MGGAPAYRRARAFFGTHAYVVHRRGLQKIFAYPHLYPIEEQIDAGGWPVVWGGAPGDGRLVPPLLLHALLPRALAPRLPRHPPLLPAPPPHAVLGDMSRAGALHVYALAEPLVEQDSRRFRSTIQVSGARGGAGQAACGGAARGPGKQGLVAGTWAATELRLRTRPHPRRCPSSGGLAPTRTAASEAAASGRLQTSAALPPTELLVRAHAALPAWPAAAFTCTHFSDAPAALAASNARLHLTYLFLSLPTNS